MSNLVRPFLMLCAWLLANPGGWAKEESVLLYEDRRVVFAVPEGFHFQRAIDERGAVRVLLTDSSDQVHLRITLMPDPQGKLTARRAQKEFLADNFQEYVEHSVEKVMEFEELSTRSGSVTYFIVTDEKLAGRTEFPPNDYLHATIGIKAIAGCTAVFTLLSNDTKSKDYTAAMKLLREGLRVQTASGSI